MPVFWHGGKIKIGEMMVPMRLFTTIISPMMLVCPSMHHITKISVRFCMGVWYLNFDAHYEGMTLLGLSIAIKEDEAGMLVNSLPAWSVSAYAPWVLFRGLWSRVGNMVVGEHNHVEWYEEYSTFVYTKIWVCDSLPSDDVLIQLARHKRVARDVVINKQDYSLKDNREYVQRIFDADREHRAPINE